MEYETFDLMGDKKSRNKIIAFLKTEAHTFDEIGKEVEMPRTSIFYHIKCMEDEEMIIKRFIGRVAYIGLRSKFR